MSSIPAHTVRIFANQMPQNADTIPRTARDCPPSKRNQFAITMARPMIKFLPIELRLLKIPSGNARKIKNIAENGIASFL